MSKEFLSSKSSSPITKLIGDLSNTAKTEQESCSDQLTLKNLLKVSAGCIGLVSGLPWLKSAYESGRGDSNLGLVIAGSMLISYGATTAWACFDIIDTDLYKIPLEYSEFVDNKSKRKHLIEHLAYHLLGVLTTIPAAYVSVVFNNGKYIYLPLVVIVQYIFNTFGIYKLADHVLKPFLKYIREALCHKTAESTKTLTPHAVLDKLFDHLYLTANCENLAILPSIQNISESEILQYSSVIFNNEILSKQQASNLSLKDIFTASVVGAGTIIFPTANLITYSVMTYHGLFSLSDNKILCYSLMPVILAPLYSLDLFATKQGLTSILDHSFELCNSEYKQPLMYNQHKVLFYLLAIVAIVLSGFAAINNQYVFQQELETSIFDDYALLLSLSTFITTLCLQGLGLTTTLLNSSSIAIKHCEPNIKTSETLKSKIQASKTIGSYLAKEYANGFLQDVQEVQTRPNVSSDSAEKRLLGYHDVCYGV